VLSNAHNLNIVTCSNWLKQQASLSSLLRNKPIYTIPNPIDTQTFKPSNKLQHRKLLGLDQNKKYILFAAANINNYFKGFSFFVEAIELLTKQYPQISNLLEIVIVGKVKDERPFTRLKIPYSSLGTFSPEKMINVYNAVDLFITSSIQDNLPNTIMESMACGVPVVAFDVGGIPDLIDHQQNGWLATFKSAQSLAEGIYWCLFEADYAHLSQQARQKVVTTFAENIIAEKYLKLYKQLLGIS
jgi:glycosyltransferase involved in cell wall biosynthesis